MSFKNTSLDKFSPTPLYQQLCDIFYDMLNKGEISIGDKLPTESEIMAYYDISRSVVRQALDELRQRNLIFTKRALGSFIAPAKIEKMLEVNQSFHESMEKSGIDFTVEIINKGIKLASKDVAEELQISEGSQVFHLERVAFVKNVPVNYLSSYIKCDICDSDIMLRFVSGSLYKYINLNFGLELYSSTGTRVLEMDFANEKESKVLKIPRGSSLMLLSSRSFDQHERLVEYSQVAYLASFFKFRY